MNSAYGKVIRSISMNSACFSLPGTKPGAMSWVSHGAASRTTAVSTSNPASRVPATRSTNSRTAWGPCCSLYSANTGTKAIENEPSADSRRMKLGMRKAAMNTSIAGLAPNTIAYTWSRTSPETRDRKVIALNTAVERSKRLMPPPWQAS